VSWSPYHWYFEEHIVLYICPACTPFRIDFAMKTTTKTSKQQQQQRQRHRYQLARLAALYPDFVLILVVRNPLDMAASVFEHLRNRAKEFSALHGGYAEAAGVLVSRCGHLHPSKPNVPANCELNPGELAALANCAGSTEVPLTTTASLRVCCTSGLLPHLFLEGAVYLLRALMCVRSYIQDMRVWGILLVRAPPYVWHLRRRRRCRPRRAQRAWGGARRRGAASRCSSGRRSTAPSTRSAGAA